MAEISRWDLAEGGREKNREGRGKKIQRLCSSEMQIYFLSRDSNLGKKLDIFCEAGQFHGHGGDG